MKSSENSYSSNIPSSVRQFATDFLIGGVSASTAKTLGAPLERVKILFQNQNELLHSGKLSRPYTGIWDCLKTITKEEGLLKLWRGNYTNVLRYFPSQALSFALKDHFQQYNYAKTEGEVKWILGNIFIGGLSGFFATTITYSLDYTRTILSSDLKKGKYEYNGIVDVYKKTYQKSGISGLYRGYWINAPVLFIYRGIYFGAFDSFKSFTSSPKNDDDDSIDVDNPTNGNRCDGSENGFWNNKESINFIKECLSTFSLAYVVSFIAAIPVYPLDTLRRRIMINPSQSALRLLQDIVRKEGAFVLFYGFKVNVIRSLAGATSLFLYDRLKSKFFT